LAQIFGKFECLVLFTLAFVFTVDGVDADFFVILLEGGQVLTGLGELTLFHTFTDIPVDEGTLGVHEIELVVETSPGLGDSGSVGQHADGTLDLGQVTAGNDGWWLVVDTDLETSWAPVNELDSALGLDVCDGGVDVLGDDVTSVQEAAGHVLAVAGIALDHLVGWLEAGVGDLGDGELLVVGLLGRDDWGVSGEREVDTWVGDQVSLELGEIDIESTIESEGGGDGGNDLADETVQVGVSWSLNVEVATADVVDGLVVDHEGTVGVLQGGVGGEDGVVGLDDGGGDLWGWVNSKFELGFLAVVNGEALHQEGGETGTGTATEGVEDKETLETSALIGQFSDSVQDQVDDLLTDGVVATGVVVGGILLTGDQLFWVEKLTVGTGADLIDDGWLQINEDGAWDVLAGSSLREKGVEGVVTTTDGLVRGHLTIRLDTVLQAVELPAGITHLDTSLANMNGDNFTHFELVGTDFACVKWQNT